MEEDVVNNLISTFFIGETRWGINIKDTQEVIRIPDITKVHNAQKYVEGIINLRGKIVTVLSLTKKLGIEPSCQNDDNRIIIVNYLDEFIGLYVDNVSDVIEVELDSLQPAPSTLNGINGSNIKGIYHHEDFTIAILNLKNILNLEEEIL
jgi:purine-binding chemotaxis protein CheW